MMDGLNVMAVPHTIALTLLCDALARWIKLTKQMAKATALVRGSTGNKVPNPLFKMQKDAWDQVLRACREFGMTPSAVTSVKSVSVLTTKSQNDSKIDSGGGLQSLRLAE